MLDDCIPEVRALLKSPFAMSHSVSQGPVYPLSAQAVTNLLQRDGSGSLRSLLFVCFITHREWETRQNSQPSFGGHSKFPPPGVSFHNSYYLRPAALGAWERLCGVDSGEGPCFGE